MQINTVKVISVFLRRDFFERKRPYVCITITLAHPKHLIMTAAVAVGSVLVRRPWSFRFHRAASIRSTACTSMSRRGLAPRSGDLAARQGSAWPLARTPSSLAARAYMTALVVAVGNGDCGFEVLGFD